MNILIFFLAYCIEGVVLAIAGLTVLTWEYWAITVLTGVAAMALAWRK